MSIPCVCPLARISNSKAARKTGPVLCVAHAMCSKPRNILLLHRESSGCGRTKLCDLDAAVPIGKRRPKGLKNSSGYCAPQVARILLQSLLAIVLRSATRTEEAGVIMDEKHDVWSLGVLLFELCAGPSPLGGFCRCN